MYYPPPKDLIFNKDKLVFRADKKSEAMQIRKDAQKCLYFVGSEPQACDATAKR